MGDQLLPLPLTERSVHLCVDMQRIFSAKGPWPTPWTHRLLAPQTLTNYSQLALLSTATIQRPQNLVRSQKLTRERNSWEPCQYLRR